MSDIWLPYFALNYLMTIGTGLLMAIAGGLIVGKDRHGD